MPGDQTKQKALVGLTVLLGLASGILFLFFASKTTWVNGVILQTLFLTAVAWAAEISAVNFSQRIRVSCANLPVLLGIFFLGPAPSAVIAGISALLGSKNKQFLKICYNVFATVVPVIIVSQLFILSREAAGLSPFPSSVSLDFLFGGFLSGITWEIIDFFLISIAVSLSSPVKFSSLWKQIFIHALPSHLLILGVGLVIAAIYLKAGVAAAILFFIPIFASQHVYNLLVQQKDLLGQQTKLSEDLMEMNIGLAGALIMLLDSKDHYTANHSAGVAMYCRDMAKLMGMDEDQQRVAHMAGLLHDLGKVGTPDAVLKKEGELTSQEWEQVKQHPTTAAEVLSQLATHKEIADIIRHHQEHFDGSGYPYGLSGEEIPELSRMLAVADTYHALTSTRPYREAKNPFEALMVLRRVAGTQLDPKYVELLAQVLKDEDLTYRKGSKADFLSEFRKGRPAFMKGTLYARAKS